jgi:hypothetical protein
MGRHDSTKAQTSKWFTSSSSGGPLYATGLTGNKTVVQLSGANMEWVIKRYNQYRKATPRARRVYIIHALSASHTRESYLHMRETLSSCIIPPVLFKLVFLAGWLSLRFIIPHMWIRAPPLCCWHNDLIL